MFSLLMILWVSWDGILAGWAVGLGQTPPQFSQFKATFFSQAERKFLNKMLLFIHNHFKICCSIWNVFFSLNLWMCELLQSVSEWSFLNWPYWTGSENLNLPMRGEWRGSGELIYSWMLWSILFSVRGWTHHTPLPLHHRRLTHRIAHNTQVVRPCDGLEKLRKHF